MAYGNSSTLYKPQTTPRQYERRWRKKPRLDLLLWAECLDPGSVEYRTGRKDRRGTPASHGAKRFGLWVQQPYTAPGSWVQFRFLCPRGFHGRASTLASAFDLAGRRLAWNTDVKKWAARQPYGVFTLGWIEHALCAFAEAVEFDESDPNAVTEPEPPRSPIVSAIAAEKALEGLDGEERARFLDVSRNDYPVLIFDGGEDLWLPFETDKTEADRRLLGRAPTEEDVEEWKLGVDRIRVTG